jgi:O-antigen ligase
MFTCMATVVMTRSRGASLALGTTLLLLAFRSKHKVLVLSLMAALSVIPVALIYQRYMMRMSALSDPLSDPSIRSRLVHYRAALRVARDYPLTGVGFGNENYQLIQDRYIPEVATGEFRRLKVHNTYLQVLVDSGIFAFGIFVYLLISTLVQLQRSIRRCRRDYPHLLAFPYALQVALVSYAQYCLTGGRESWDFYYILLMTTVTWLALEKEVRRSLSAEPAPAMAPALPPLAAPVAGYSGQPGPSKPAVPAPGRSRYRFLDVRR